MTKAEDRRKVNKWRQKIFISVSASVIASSVYGVYAAGKAVEKIESEKIKTKTNIGLVLEI